jgi:4-amino-4-deoxy-L-arabinose transferase-like glycosyltransferase
VTASPDIRPILIAVLAGFLIFANLGDHLLWQDEAETAVLSESLLENGKPIALYRDNLVFQSSVTFDETFVWRFHPWGQFYVTALSFALLGTGTFAARFPFALLGFLSLLLSYSLYRKRLGFSPNAALLTSLILALSVPFLLHVRQCRYYSLGLLFTILLVDGFLGLLVEGSGKSARRAILYVECVLGGVLLLFTNFSVLFPTLLALALYIVTARRDRLKDPRFVAASLLIVLPAVIGFFYLGASGHTAPLEYANARLFITNLAIFIKFLDEFYLPILLLLALPLIPLLSRSKRVGLPGGYFGRMKWLYADLPYKGFFAALIVSNILFFSLMGDWAYARYLLHLLPFIVIFAGAPLYRLAASLGPLLAAGAVTLFLVWVNLAPPLVSLALRTMPFQEAERKFSGSLVGDVAGAFGSAQEAVNTNDYEPRLRGPMILEYLYELTHEYSGYIGPVLGFLEERAKPGDTVLIGYEDLPLVFHTDLRVRGGLQRIGLRESLGLSPTFGLELREPPEFIVWKGFTRAEGLVIQRKFARLGARYEETVIGIPDIPWENRPDPWYHKFRSPPVDRNLRIWVLRGR